MLAGGRYEVPVAAGVVGPHWAPPNAAGEAAAEGERRAKRGTNLDGLVAEAAAAAVEAEAEAPQKHRHGVEAASYSVPDVPRRVAAVAEEAAEAVAPRGWPGGSGVVRH